MSNFVYSNGEYFVIRTVNPRNRPFKVVSKDYKLHTHLRTRKEAIDIANYAKYLNIPLNSKIDYLISLRRIVKDEVTCKKIDNLISTKRDKISQKKYFNVNKGIKQKITGGNCNENNSKSRGKYRI